MVLKRLQDGDALSALTHDAQKNAGGGEGGGQASVGTAGVDVSGPQRPPRARGRLRTVGG